MATQEILKQDFERALRARDTAVVDTLRLLLSALKNRSIEKKGKTGSDELNEEETMEVVMREVKKRKEASELFIKGGRQDLADKEHAELKILEKYLPPQMDEAEVEKVVKAYLAGLGEVNAKDFGKIMGGVMKELKGKADANLVTKILKDSLK